MGSLWGMKVLEFLTGLISPEQAAYVEGSRLIKSTLWWVLEEWQVNMGPRYL